MFVWNVEQRQPRLLFGVTVRQAFSGANPFSDFPYFAEEFGGLGAEMDGAEIDDRHCTAKRVGNFSKLARCSGVRSSSRPIRARRGISLPPAWQPRRACQLP